MNKSLAITLSAAALVVVIAICVLIVLSALAGQTLASACPDVRDRHVLGHHRCANTANGPTKARGTHEPAAPHCPPQPTKAIHANHPARAEGSSLERRRRWRA